MFLASLYYIHPAGRKYPLLLHFLFPPLSIPHPLIPYFMLTGGFFALVSLLQRVGELPLPLLTSALSPPPKPGAFYNVKGKEYFQGYFAKVAL